VELSMKSHRPVSIRWITLLSLVITSLVPLSSRAQVAPVGAHHATSGPGAGLDASVSPTGAYQTSAPITLPPPRGRLPVPFTVAYTGSANAGAAGAGWDVPIWYVRRSVSTVHRKPSLDYTLTQDVVPERVFLSMGGGQRLMVPGAKDNVYLPFVSDQYLELQRDKDGWLLKTSDNLDYRFIPVETLGIHDAELWVLSEILDRASGDRVLVQYEVYPTTDQYPELDIVGFSYAYGTNGKPLYEIVLKYEEVGFQSRTDTWGVVLGRSRVLSDVVVNARNNLDAKSSPHDIRTYHLTYSPDPDTSKRRLTAVSVTGETGEKTLPLATYSYGSATQGGEEPYVRYSGQYVVPVWQGSTLGDVLPGDTIAMGTSVVSRDVDGGFIGNDGVITEMVRSRYAVRDFTGDNIPDLLYRVGSTWNFVRGYLTDAGPRLDGGVAATWTQPAEIYEQRTFRPESGDPVWWLRASMVVTEQLTEFIDWNGDGRLDIVDVRGGSDIKHWRVWLNLPDQVGNPSWSPRDVDVSDLHKHVSTHNLLGFYSSGYLATRRSRTWAITERMDGPTGVPVAMGPVRTIGEWTLDDVNGDGFLDHIANTNPVRNCMDVESHPCLFMAGQSGCYADIPTVEACRDELNPPPHNQHQIILRRQGLIESGSDRPYAVDPPYTWSDSGVDYWSTGEAGFGPLPDEMSLPPIVYDYSSSEGGPSWGDGTGVGRPFLHGGLQAKFVSDRETRCEEYSDYETRQTEGKVDLNGDGYLDVVRLKKDGTWWASFGSTAGVGIEREIQQTPGGLPFDLSVTWSACDGSWSATIGGLEDIDGDGRPELVRLQDHVLKVEYLENSAGKVGDLGIGRLTAIGNGFGATTLIHYANNKAESWTGHDVPAPEVVVSETRIVVDDGSSPDTIPVRYAYGAPDRIYDTSVNRIVFLGYRRTVTLVGEQSARTGTGRVSGYAITTDREPPDGYTHEKLVLAGRVEETTRVEGTLSADPRELLPHVSAYLRRAGSKHEYGVVELPVSAADPVGVIECAHVNLDGTVPNYFETVCNRAAIVYERSRYSWEGAEAPEQGNRNVVLATYVEKVDEIGRPLEIHDYGDARTFADDRCLSMTYAEPASEEARLVTALAGIWTSDCGWIHPKVGTSGVAPGTPVLIAGQRFVYDGLAEGYVGKGQITSSVVESYDTSTGASLGEHVAATLSYDALGNVTQAVATRATGTAATRTTTFTYDDFGVSVKSTTETASDVPSSPFTRQGTFSVWPSVEQTETGLNGETVSTTRDSLGRTTTVTASAPNVSHTVEKVEYKDDVAGRMIATTSYPAAAGSAQVTHARLDALGRVRFRQTYLGADYNGATMISGVTSYDAWGRAQYRAFPFDWDATELNPADLGPDPAHWPRGITTLFDHAGRVVGVIEADGMRTDASTSVTAAVYASTVSYDWDNGQRVVRRRGPGDNDPSAATFGAWSESRQTGSGSDAESARYQPNDTRLDLVRRYFDRFGNETAVHRFGDPVNSGGIVAWTRHYDSSGQLLSSSEPGAAPVTNTYDEWGGLVRSQWAEGTSTHQVRHRYDGFGRATALDVVLAVGGTFPIEATESAERYYYDTHSGSPSQPAGPLLGRLSKAETLGVGANYYSYDPFGRVATETYSLAAYGQDVTVSTAYEPGGLTHSLTYKTAAGTDTIEYRYDTAFRVRQVLSGATTVFDATEVDAKGRYRSIHLGNGVTETFAYAPTGREDLLQWQVNTPSGTYSNVFSGRDADGRVVNEQVNVFGSASTRAYTYDSRGRLSRSVTLGAASNLVDEQFTYDPLGNVLTKRDVYAPSQNRDLRYDVGVPDRLCRADVVGQNGSGCHFTYDGAGNVLSDTSNIAGASRSFTYDSAGRVTSIQKGTWGAGFTYGPGGALVATEVRSSGALHHRTWTFGDLIEIRRRSDGGTDIERRILGPLGVVATLRTDSTQSETVYVHGDGRGNRTFTRGNGTAAQTVNYRAFGQVKSDTGTSSSLTYTDDLWNGGDDLRDLGVVVLGARIYDPALGRFLQPDPIAYSGSSGAGNPYSFAFNDPVNFSDPTGLFFQLNIYASTCADCADSPSTFEAVAALISIVGMALHNGGGHAAGPPSAADTIKHVLEGAANLVRRWDCTIMCNAVGSFARGVGDFAVGTVKGLAHTALNVGKCWLVIDIQGCGRFINATGAGLVHTVTGGAGFAVDVVTDPSAAWHTFCAKGGGDCWRAAGNVTAEVVANIFLGGAGRGAGAEADVAGEVVAGDLAATEAAAAEAGAAEAATARGTVPRTWCFPAGTKVHTPDGLVNIEDLDPGDEVLAYDIERREVVVRRVSVTSTAWSEHLVDVDVAGETIASTASHPYWEETTQRWVEAAELRPGMVLRMSNGSTSVVHTVKERAELVEVHNFEVAGEHNYFVGASGVLVHNGGPDAFDDYNQALNKALDWLAGRGFMAERQVIGRLGTNVGRPIGMSTADGRVGFRVEFDVRSGAHINVWDFDAPKGLQKGPHFKFNASEKTVNRIVRQFGC